MTFEWTRYTIILSSLKGSNKMEENKIVEVSVIEQGGKVASERMDVKREVMSFEKLMDMATMLAKSTIVPLTYQNRPENTFVALDMASRMGVSPMVVMQNLHIIQGKPSWSGQAMASMIRNSAEFRNVEVTYVGQPNTDTWGAYVSAEKVATGKIIKGGTVTIAIAKREGWFQKSGSKWQTMPELMLAYRAYAWFGRVYCPEILMGLQSTEEVYDVNGGQDARPVVTNPYEGV